MTTTVTVENHQPVPLVPLTEVVEEMKRRKEYRAAVYFGDTSYHGEVDSDNKWGIVSLSGDVLIFLDGSHPPLLDGIDTDETTGRLLQPGERLVVTYTNEE